MTLYTQKYGIIEEKEINYCRDQRATKRMFA